MRVQTNAVVQILGTAMQAINLLTPAIPPKYHLWAAVALSTIQGVIGVLAHFSNPDGTKVVEAPKVSSPTGIL